MWLLILNSNKVLKLSIFPENNSTVWSLLGDSIATAGIYTALSTAFILTWQPCQSRRSIVKYSEIMGVHLNLFVSCEMA